MDVPTRAVSGYACINHVDGGLVVAEEHSWMQAREPKISQDKAQIMSEFSNTDGSIKFGLSRTGDCGCLSFALVGNAAAGNKKSEAGGGASRAKTVGMGRELRRQLVNVTCGVLFCHHGKWGFCIVCRARGLANRVSCVV